MGAVHQGFGRDIEKQLAGQFLIAEMPARTFSARHFQVAQAAGMTGHGKQRYGGVQRAIGGAATEGLIAENAPL